MPQQTVNRPDLDSEENTPRKAKAILEKGQKHIKSIAFRFWSPFKEMVKKNEGKKDMLDFTVLLTSMMTLMAWRTMDLVKAEYEGKAGTYWFCQIAIVIILAALILHGICMVGYTRWKSIFNWISGVLKAAQSFWNGLSRRGKAAGIASLLLVFILLPLAAYFVPRPSWCAQVEDLFGIPTAQGSPLSWSERQGRAGCWRIDDYPWQNRMTLTYVEAYGQLEVMSDYSTLYERAFFQPTAKIEIKYRKDKEFYKNFPEDVYSSARQIGYRVPLRVSYYNSSSKNPVLELERDSHGNMEIVSYSPEDKPQLLNSTLLRIPDGQTGEKSIVGQSIETVYGPDGLPELRRLSSQAYNLYGVNGERYSYNRDRQISAISYLDAGGELTCNKLGVMMVEFEYQSDTNLRSIRYYGDQKGTERVEGFHGVFCEILEYDEEGKNISSRRQKDRSENWCFDANGVYQYRYQYEGRALVREEFLAVDTAPIQDIRFNSRWVQFRRENHGRSICVELEPVASAPESGAAAVSNTFQAQNMSVLFWKETPDLSSGDSSYDREAPEGTSKGPYKTVETSDSESVPSRRYSQIRYALKGGKNRLVTEISYWDGEGCAAVGDQGCAATRFDYQQGRVIRESYWDSDGQPCVLGGGYTAVEYAYGPGQDLVRTVYLDSSGQPVMNRDLGCAIVQVDRSGPRQELVQTFYYDKDENLTALPDKGYAKIEQRYDTNGFLIQETFYDANDAIACRTDLGVAKIRYEYAPDGNLIRESYWDQEDNAASRRDTGYAVVNQAFTHGQLTEKRFETYRDRAYYPVPDRETGAAVITYLYKDGQKIEERYLDENRNPVLSADLGCAVLEFRYEHGRLREKSARGLQDELILRKDAGCAIVQYDYDDFGRQTVFRYLDADENPICRSDTGCAEVEYKYDGFGRRISVKYYDTDHKLVIHKENGHAGVEYEYPNGNNEVWKYIGPDDEPFPRGGGHGIVEVDRMYNSTGKTQGESYKDADGQPAVWKDHGYSSLFYEYNANGLKMQDAFFGVDGSPALRLDEGYARKTYEYDSAGRIIRTRFYGDGQNRVINTKYHCFGFEYEYDERGLESVIRYLGADDAPMIRLDYGFSEVRKTYDSAGNLRGESFYIGDTPAVWKERGYASYEDTYENGLRVESRYYDTEGKLTPRLDRGYAIVRLEYDACGRCVRERYYDEEDRPVISPYYSCAGFEYEYNERGLESVIRYLDTDGGRMVRQDLGYAEIHEEYDDAGHLTVQRYLDAGGKPAVSKSRGYASFLDTYDETGKCILSQYFDVNGAPTAWKDQGHTSIKREYNEFRQLTAVYYYDAAGNLMINREEGCAGYRYDYDALGNRTDTWYVSPEGEEFVMVRDSSGYAHIFSEYNEFGQEAAVYYYLTEDRSAPAVAKDLGYSRMKKIYDNNRCVQIEYQGTDGAPVLRSDEGYSVVKYTYDRCGQELSSIYYGTDGATSVFNQKYGCAGFLYTYDEFGNKTDIRYIDADGEPLLRRDWGLSHIQYRHDDFGNEIHRAYYAEAGQPAVRKDEGYVSSESKYNQQGKCVETRFYDAQNNLTLRQDGGYAIVRYEYDAFGRTISRSYFDQNDTPVINTEENYASVRYAYDALGRQTDTWYYGLDGALICLSESGYAHVHSDYDSQGNEIRAEYRDENDDLVLHKTYGFAYALYEYRNEEGRRYITASYYDTEGRPIIRKDRGFAGYVDIYDEHGNWVEGRSLDTHGNLVRRTDEDHAVIRLEYDRWNRRIRVTYFDEFDQPAVSQHFGCAGFAYEYDERGNQTAVRYLAPGGGLMVRTGYGFAQAVRDYDDQGRLLWEWLQDAEGNPALWKDRGYAAYAVKYNDIGKKESEWYYDQERKLTARSDLGYAYIGYQYTIEGWLSRKDYYGPDNERVLNTETHCASICYDYDARGNNTYTQYYGIDQELINREDTGASLCYREFDELDRQTWIGYYIYADGDWQLVNRRDLGYAAISDTYDEKGLWLERNYLDAEGQPVTHAEKGYATLKCAYDENNLILSKLFLDAGGKPVDTNEGRAKWEWEYDANGRLVNKTSYYAADL